MKKEISIKIDQCDICGFTENLTDILNYNYQNRIYFRKCFVCGKLCCQKCFDFVSGEDLCVPCQGKYKDILIRYKKSWELCQNYKNKIEEEHRLITQEIRECLEKIKQEKK